MLEMDTIQYQYPRGFELFNGISETLHPGEMIAITGPSGRGKSTLLYILGLMRKPSHGDIRINGRSAFELNDVERSLLRARMFGFIFQDGALDPSRTILDNVLEGAIYRGETRRGSLRSAYALLEQFGVQLRSRAKPGQVSGGQAQRIALCRALLGNPPILLADEPTGNLDDDSAQLVIDTLLQRAITGSIVAVATHDSAVIARCHRRLDLI